MMNQFWGHMWYGWIFWVVIIGLIIWAVVTIVNRSSTDGTTREPGGESAMDVLKKRYASGEISKEEFEEKKQDLQ